MRNAMKSALAMVLGAAALVPSTAQGGQNQVGLQIIEEDIGGVETARAVWSSDPGAMISVTPVAGIKPEVWLIDLTGSGHATLGGGDFPGFDNGGVMTWIEPEHPGLYNNLYYVDDLHWRLESEQEIPANKNNDGVFGVFDNGVSIYAGGDFNGDAVFVSVIEREVPEPASLALFGAGLAGLVLRRKKQP